MAHGSTLAVVSSTLLIGSCHKGGAAQTPPAPTVQVVEVEQQDVPIYGEWIGTLEGFVNADIKPQVTGYIRKPFTPEQVREQVTPVLKGKS